ncbi:MAG: hypothetical protein ACRECR_03865, partial [Thermoplasmata archaeon]
MGSSPVAARAAPTPASPLSGWTPEPTEPVPSPLLLFGLEFSLSTATLDALEVVVRSVTREEITARFASARGTEEVALLSTCHRVELALLVSSPEELLLWQDWL